jgi:hypothetical protein
VPLTTLQWNEDLTTDDLVVMEMVVIVENNIIFVVLNRRGQGIMRWAVEFD